MPVIPSPDPYGPDVIAGLCQVLLNDAATLALVSDRGVPNRVSDTELDPAFDVVMPAKAIVVKPHGGPRPDAMLEINRTRVQLQTFGDTAHLAHVVYTAAYNALKNLTPSVWAGTYIHSCKPQAGPIPYRDVELQWPYLVSMWLVTASDLAVAA